MRRFLLAFAIAALGAAEVGDIESGLESARRGLQSHPLAQRKLSGLHQRAAAAAVDPPTPDDLAETRVVQLTTEIMARAAALGKDAASIHACVAANVDYEPYHGQMQNSQAVLLSRRGNDFDQATLLIALLRASGEPARYVIGGITLTLPQVKEWMGAGDGEAALALLGWNWDYLRKGDQVDTSHVWVEAWLDT